VLYFLVYDAYRRSIVLRHDFLARLRHFYARQLTFCTNVLRFHDAGGRLRLVELMYCSQESLSVYFSLSSLFLMIQIICISKYYCSNLPSFSTKGISTPSASPSFSCNIDDRPLCDRVLSYGGGGQHQFPALAVEPYITAGLNYCNDNAFKYVDHVDSLGQVAYPIEQDYVHTNIPLRYIVPHLSVKVALKTARLHRLQIGSHVPKSEICRILEAHN
jgi:hypothetical protein